MLSLSVQEAGRNLVCDCGGIANWVGGIGSFLAGGAALVVLLLGHCQRRRAEDEERERRKHEQALQVTWWAEHETGEGPASRVREFADSAESFEGDYENSPELGKAIVVVQNSSNDCLYEAALQLPASFEPGPARRRNDSPQEFLRRQIGVLPPGRSNFRIPLSYRDTPTQVARFKGEPAFNKCVEWVEFRDRNNVIWRRFGDGRLEQQPDRPSDTETAYSP